MSWKRRNPEKPVEEDDEDVLEEKIDAAPDILEVDDTEFLDEEALLQGDAEDDDVDESANDDLLESDISGETRSARLKEAMGEANIGPCKSDTLQSTLQELPASPGRGCKEEAKIEKSQSDGNAEGTQYCEDKPSATQSVGPKNPKGGDSSEAATMRAEAAGRKQDTSSKKTSASVLDASEQPVGSLRRDAHRITSDKGETSSNRGRYFASSRSRASSRGGRFSSKTDRRDQATHGSNGLHQSRRDSRFAHRGPYSRGHSDSRGKPARMPYAARPAIGMSQPSHSSFGMLQQYRPASDCPPDAQQTRMTYAAHPPVETSPSNLPAVSYGVSQAHLRDFLCAVIGSTVSGPKRTPEMPAIETNSAFAGPVLESTGLGSCSPDLVPSGASLLRPLPHQQWPLPGDRAGVRNHSFEAASQQLHVDSKGTSVVRRGAPTASDCDNNSPSFSPRNLSCVSNEAAELPTYFGKSDLNQRHQPSSELRYESSENPRESAPKSHVGHNDTFKNVFPASREDFPKTGATRDVDVPKMHIDYNHGNGDCDYRIPAQPRKKIVAVGVGGTADPTEPGDREDRTQVRRDGLSHDLAHGGNSSDNRHLERGDTVLAGSKRRNPSGTERARATISEILSFDDPSSMYDDVKRSRIDGLSDATSLQFSASSAAWDVATGGQSVARVARFSKSSTSNQDLSLTANFSDDAPVKKSPNSDEYNKRLQEQIMLRKQITRRKEEQRRQEAERRRGEMEKSRENDSLLTPYDAGHRNPKANKTEVMPRRNASSSQSLLRTGLAEPDFRVSTLEESANVDDTAGAAGVVAATASAKTTAFAATGFFRTAGSEAKSMRPTLAAGGPASSGNVLLRERYRKLRLQAEQDKPASSAAQSTKSALKSPNRKSSNPSFSDGDNSGSVAASLVLPEPQRESNHRTLSNFRNAGNAAAAMSAHRVSSIHTASVRGSARNSASPRSPHFASSIRTLSDGDNAGNAAAMRGPCVLSGRGRQFGADEPTSPGCESAASHHCEDFQPRPHRQRPQQESRRVLAVDSNSTNQIGRLLVDYGRGNARDHSAELSAPRGTKVTICNLPPNSSHLPLLLAAASFGKVMDVRSDGTGVVTVEFEMAEQASLFCQNYHGVIFDNARISVKIEPS